MSGEQEQRGLGGRLPKQRKPRSASRVLAIAAGIALLALAIAVGMDAYRSRAVEPVERAIEKDLGFRHGTPYRDGKEVLTIEDVVPGKPMAEAGIRSGDVVVSPTYHDTRDFLGDLAASRGSTRSMTVERDRKRMSVLVRVPRQSKE